MPNPAMYQTGTLSAIASAIAAKPVRVITNSTPTAYFDPTTRTIAVTQQATFEAARGFLAHELLHERFTLPADWDAVCDLAPYHNLVEDVRINLGQSDSIYRHAKTWIFDTWDWLKQREPQGKWDASKPSISFLYLAHKQIQEPKPWDQEVADLWTKRAGEILRAPNIRVLRPILEELKALDEKYTGQGDKPEPSGGEQPTPPPTKPKGQGRGGKLTKQQQQDYNDAVDEHRRAEQQKACDKAAAEQAKSERAATGSPLHSLHDPITVQGRGQQTDEAGASSCKTGSFGSRDHRFDAKPVDTAILEKLRAWRNRMAEALMANDAGAPTRNLPRGRLDGTKLHHIAANTSDRVFIKPTETRRAVNTAIDIMLDVSSSTRIQDANHHLAASAYALGEACSRVPGVQLGMLRFGSEFQRIFPIAPNRGVRLEQATAVATGCTETESAALRSTAELRLANAQRRICINCTDGAPLSQDTRKLIVSLGIEYYELHIVAQVIPGQKLQEEVGDMLSHDPDPSYQILVTAEEIHNGLDRLVRTLKIKGR